jgi:hypothetical protein
VPILTIKKMAIQEPKVRECNFKETKWLADLAGAWEPNCASGFTRKVSVNEQDRADRLSTVVCDRLARTGLGRPIGEHGFDRAAEPILIEALVAWVHMIAVFVREVAAPVRPAPVGVAKRVLL